jgi:hypothetical protein
LSASLLHLRSRLPPCSAVLLRVPSAEAQCARAWPRVGVPVRLPVGLPLSPALVHTTGPKLPCVYRRGLTQVCSVPPLRLHAAVPSSTPTPLFLWETPSQADDAAPSGVLPRHCFAAPSPQRKCSQPCKGPPASAALTRCGQRPSNYYDITTPLAYAPQSTSRG